eukprot:g26753.t1
MLLQYLQNAAQSLPCGEGQKDNLEFEEKLPNLNGQKDPKEVKQVPTPPTTSSIGRYIPSFLRKVRFISKEVSEGETQPRKVERRNSERPMKSKAIVDDKDLSNVHEVHQADD